MDKQAILKWVNDLIERYAETSKSFIEESSSDVKGSINALREECNDLREEIKELLNLSNVDQIKAKIKEVSSEGYLEYYSATIDELGESDVQEILLEINGEYAVVDVVINKSEYLIEICWCGNQVCIWCVPRADFDAVY